MSVEASLPLILSQAGSMILLSAPPRYRSWLPQPIWWLIMRIKSEKSEVSKFSKIRHYWNSLRKALQKKWRNFLNMAPKFHFEFPSSIEMYIIPSLSIDSRGKTDEVPTLKIVQAMLYRVKIGCQWNGGLCPSNSSLLASRIHGKKVSITIIANGLPTVYSVLPLSPCSDCTEITPRISWKKVIHVKFFINPLNLLSILFL